MDENEFEKPLAGWEIEEIRINCTDAPVKDPDDHTKIIYWSHTGTPTEWCLLEALNTPVTTNENGEVAVNFLLNPPPNEENIKVKYPEILPFIFIKWGNSSSAIQPIVDSPTHWTITKYFDCGYCEKFEDSNNH